MSLDLEAILAPVAAPNAPCGPDPFADDESELGNQYVTFTNKANALAEPISRNELPAAQARSREISELALAVLEKSKHLGAGVHLALAELRSRGLPGFAEGLAVVHGLLQRYWEPLHPQRAPDETFPEARLRTLSTLTDHFSCYSGIYDAELLRTRQGTSYSVGDLLVAAGSIELPLGWKKKPLPEIKAAAERLSGTELEAFKQVQEAIRASIQSVDGIIELQAKQVGQGRGQDLGPLRRVLADVAKHVAALANRPPPVEAREASEGNAMATNQGGNGSGGGAGAGNVAGPGAGRAAGAAMSAGAIASRNDVKEALRAIRRYYDDHEPSSPVPLLLQRAEKLVDLDFMQIVRDLSPRAIEEMQGIFGVRDGDEARGQEEPASQ